MIYAIIGLAVVVVIIAPIKIRTHSYFSSKEKILVQNIKAGALKNFAFNISMQNNKLYFNTKKKSKNLLASKPAKNPIVGEKRTGQKRDNGKKAVVKLNFFKPVIIDKIKVFGEVGLSDCMLTVLSISAIMIIVGTIKSALFKNSINFSTNIIPNFKQPICNINVLINININFLIIIYVSTRILLSSFINSLKKIKEE